MVEEKSEGDPLFRGGKGPGGLHLQHQLGLDHSQGAGLVGVRPAGGAILPAHAGCASRQDNAVLVLGRVCQQAVVSDLNGRCRTCVSKEPADLLGAVGIFGNQLALKGRTLHG